MSRLKYKVGDRVKIQSLERYNKYKNRYGDINYGCETEILFTSEMSSFCGQVATISQVRYIGCVRFYHLAEDKESHLWVDGMFEGPVEEETKPNIIEEAKTYWDNIKDAWICPEGYIFKDDNGNVINATKIVLEKKKKEYPKTYEECCKVMGVNHTNDLDICEHCDYKTEITYYEDSLLEKIEALYRLIICRDAYWKIAGEEMGLGKPWEPDFDNLSTNLEYIKIVKGCFTYSSRVFAFPTPEMRDAFKENFDKDIEFCKELL